VLIERISWQRLECWWSELSAEETERHRQYS